jgi:hypothetical protein
VIVLEADASINHLMRAMVKRRRDDLVAYFQLQSADAVLQKLQRYLIARSRWINVNAV